ncbi:Polymerase/histidinol phosphatase-like protein [Talaromyces proteolyticus]|uniref:Histidinol-phosphatase n=1 Tax=Talaromyces proteolyticus TaxID=1131652 RepID=A0AAD4KL49_9EURO|nr:Polymerase/histidinol phosphatase-like protein [Talaromyces proteolyticus]KAH8693913.1 Polymerase/histidinol phosphatase-like protein [Talaromyces proteolyticus]
MPFSHHSHSGEFCPSHAYNTLEEMIQTAIAKHMEVFCLTEHMPRSDEDLYPEEIASGVTFQSLLTNEENYFRKANELRVKYSTQIHILIGFESEWIRNPGSLTLIQGSLSRFSYDFFVGSVHHMHGIPIDWNREMYVRAREKSGGTDERLWEDYFDEVFNMLLHLKPMVVGHFDLIRLQSDDPNLTKGGFKRGKGVWEKIQRNLKLINSYGGLLELNSAALRKGLQAPYPAAEICQEFLAMNGRFCLSDDSHGVDHVGAKYHEMLDFTERQGITELYYLNLDSQSTSTVPDSRFPRTHFKSRSLSKIKQSTYWIM